MDQKFYRNPEWWLASERKLPVAQLSRDAFRRLAAWALLVALVAAAVLWQRTHVVRVSYEVDALRAKRNELRSVNERLQKRLDDLQSMGTTERVARQSLGMVTADPARVVYLDEPASVGVWDRLRRALAR